MSDDTKRKRSDIKYLHDTRKVLISDGHKLVHEEYINDGSDGLVIKMYHKDGDNSEKITIRQTDDGQFKYVTFDNQEKNESTLSKGDLLAQLKKSKHMKFASDFIDKQRGGRQQNRRIYDSERSDRYSDSDNRYNNDRRNNRQSDSYDDYSDSYDNRFDDYGRGRSNRYRYDSD